MDVSGQLDAPAAFTPDRSRK